MFPQQIIEELLSVAHVQAVAARAGVSISNFDKDFGIDGTFRQITAIGTQRFTSGYALDFQLKASINCFVEPEYIVYDLEVKTYNDLVHRRQASDATPCILILKVLPLNAEQWLTTNELGLFLCGACIGSIYRANSAEINNRCEFGSPERKNFIPNRC